MSTVGPIGAQTLDPNALKDLLTHSGKTSAEKIKEAGVQFEAVLVRQFLGDAMKPSIKGELDEEGPGEDTYRYFLNDMLSQNLARQGVFGIGKQLSTQLTAREVAMGHITATDASKTDKNTAVKPTNSPTGTPSAIKGNKSL